MNGEKEVKGCPWVHLEHKCLKSWKANGAGATGPRMGWADLGGEGGSGEGNFGCLGVWVDFCLQTVGTRAGL